MAHVIKRGLNIPIAGQPVQSIVNGPQIRRVGLVGDDYVGMRPRMLVSEGDRVRAGQPVFEDKKSPGVIFTAPAAGRVASINRGQKRKFESLVIEIDGDDAESFTGYESMGEVSNEQARELLIASGEWTALRTRPFSRIPAIDATASSIFVTAMDTNPLAAEPELMIANHKDAFIHGLQVLTRINNGPVYVCTRDDSRVPGGDITGVQFEAFSGPHPAGLAGTHIHFLDPVSIQSCGLDDWLSGCDCLGVSVSEGTVSRDRIVAVAGPSSQDRSCIQHVAAQI